MTGNNPPQDGTPNETVQWWATPAADAGSAPLTGVDPTMIAGGAAPGHQQPPPAPPAYPAQPSQPAYPVQPSQPAYPVQSQPAYPAQPAPGYPPQAGYPPQQPAYPQQPPAYPPQQGYPPYPPKKKGSKAWIIGVVALVVVVAVIGGVFALATKAKHNINGKDGKYSMSKVADGCAVVDPSALKKWASTPDGAPTHTEQKPSDFIGGSATCDIRYTQAAAKYQTDTASLNMELNFTDSLGSPEYDIWKKVDMATTGSGYSSGDLTGVGSEGYWQVKEDVSSYSTFADYTCATKDSNVSVQIHLNLDLSTGYSRDDAQNVCKSELTHVLTSVKK